MWIPSGFDTCSLITQTVTVRGLVESWRVNDKSMQNTKQCDSLPSTVISNDVLIQAFSLLNVVYYCTVASLLNIKSYSEYIHPKK